MALAPAAVLAQSSQEEVDKGFIVELIEDNLSGDARTVNILGFEGALSSEARIAELTVADSEGVWLTLSDVVLQWNRSALFRGVIDVETLGASSVIIARAPVSENSGPAAEASGEPFALPDLPVSIQLGELAVDRLELGETFVGEPLSVQIAGAASLGGGEASFDLSAQRLDGPVGAFGLVGGYANETNTLAIDLDFNEGPSGIVARLIDLPGRPAVGLMLQADAPLDDFTADLAISTDGVDRISGDFNLRQVDEGQGFNLDIGGDITTLFAPEYQTFFGSDVGLIARGLARADGGFDLEALDLSTQSLALQGSAQIDADGFPNRFNLTGQMASTDGQDVLLPLSGTKTYVANADLTLGFDAELSDDWEIDIAAREFSRDGLRIDTLTLAGGGVIQADTGDITTDLTYGATGLTLDDDALADALGANIDGAFKLTAASGEATRIDALTVNGAGLDVQAEAQIATNPALKIDSTIIASIDDLSRFAALTGMELGGGGDLTLFSTIQPLEGLYDLLLSGDTSDLRTGINPLDPLLAGAGTLSAKAVRDTDGTRLEGLRIATDEATVTANIDLQNDGGTAAFAIDLADISLSEPSLSGAANLSGTAELNASQAVDFDVELTNLGDIIALNGTLAPTPDGRTLNADLALDLQEAARFAQVAGRDIAGRIAGQGSVVLLADQTRFSTRLNLNTTDLQTGVAQLDPLLIGDGTWALKLDRLGETRFRLSNLSGATPWLDLSAQGNGDLNGAISANLDLNLPSAARIAPGLPGALGVMAEIARDKDLITDVTATLLGSGTEIDLQAQVAPPDQGYAITADLAVAADSLRPFSALAGRDIAGRVAANGTIAFLPDLSELSTDLALETTDLQTDIAQLDPLLTGDGTWELKLDRLGETRFQLSNLSGQTPWFDLSAQGSGDLLGALSATVDLELPRAARIAPGLPGALDLSAQVSRGEDLTSTVTAHLSGSGTEIDLSTQIAPPDQGYEITGDLDVAARSLSPFSNLAGRSLAGSLNVQLSGSTLPDLSVIDARVTAQSSALGIGVPTVDKLLRGNGRYSGQIMRDGDLITVPSLSIQTPALSVTGQLNSTGAQGSGTFDARLSDVGLFTDQLSGPISARGRADRRTGLWKVDIAASGPGGLSANADGTISDDLNLNLALDGNVPLGLANDILAPRRITGTANYNLQVRGPAAPNSVSGTINTTGTRLAVPSLSEALEDIDATIRLQNGQAQLAVQGRVQSGGTLSANGPVTLSAPYNGDLTVRLGRITLKDPELYQTKISGTIGVNGPLAGGARISGTLDLGETEVRVPSSGIGALGALPDVSHFGAPLPVQTTLNRANVQEPGSQSGAANSGVAYPLDINVLAPNRIFIRGRGLDAELGGQLRLGGTTNDIIPEGQFALTRGRLDILQQRFELTEGSASLQGDFEPYIRLTAATESSSGTIIQIIVEGPASEPEVSFQSTPELPQDEVLSQLIFGRNLSDITPLQAVQLASAVGTLAGRGGGGIIDNVRQSLNLNDFDITTDDAGNAAVRAGAYVSENVYTDVTVSSDGSTEVNLNLDITDEITARGSVDADGETSIGVFFQRDY